MIKRLTTPEQREKLKEKNNARTQLKQKINNANSVAELREVVHLLAQIVLGKDL